MIMVKGDFRIFGGALRWFANGINELFFNLSAKLHILSALFWLADRIG